MQVFSWLMNALAQIMTPTTSFDFFAAFATLCCLFGILAFFFVSTLKRLFSPSPSKKKRMLPELEEWQQPTKSIDVRARESEGADAVI